MTSILFLIHTILSQRLQMQLSQKQKRLPQFFLALGNQDLILNNCKKKMTLIADVFLNLHTPKTMVR